MSETETEQQASDSTPTLEALSDKLDRLAATVAGLVDSLHGKASEHEEAKLNRPSRTAETTREHADSLAAEIRAELSKLSAQEKAEQRTKDMEGRLAKAEKALERAPREYRRVERAMGWVRDDDR